MKPIIVIISLLGILLTFACRFKTDKPSSLKTNDSTSQLKIIYLGTAGWEITDDKTVILIDPYISRLRRKNSDSTDAITNQDTIDNRKAYGPNDFVKSDSTVINQHIKRADYILVHHSHRDHVMDVPYIALKTGATVIGTESTANIMKAYGISEEKIITVKGGEDYDFGTFSVKIIPSLHSPLDEKHYYDSRVIPKDIKAPLHVSDFVEGGSLNFLIRFDGHEIFTSGSMNYIENELIGLRPDIAIIGAAPSRHEIYDYAGRLMRVLNYPAIVLPTHWDNFTIPYNAPEDDQLDQLKSFTQEIIKASPKTKVIIPKYFQPIIFNAKEKKATNKVF
jgi:L-ascorbate metabolism protein UlaG (beta-lactamase superfamily)